jgi:hypothetical protein
MAARAEDTLPAPISFYGWSHVGGLPAEPNAKPKKTFETGEAPFRSTAYLHSARDFH